MNKKEMAMWALLGLLTISNISLHMGSKASEKRMHGVVQRMGRGDVKSRWAEMNRQAPERVRPERVMPEGRKGKPEKKK